MVVPEVVAESTVEAAAGVLGGGVGAAFGLGRSPMLLVRRARPAMGVMVRRGASLARERIMVGDQLVLFIEGFRSFPS